MEALAALHTRASVGQLDVPGPTPAQLDNLLKAGLRASDHGRLRPWKFILVEGDARERLGALFLRLAEQENPALGDDERSKLLKSPLRAPLVIVVVAKVRANDKIPAIEQRLSAAGAAQLMLVAAHAQGLGAVWRTGKMAYHAGVRDALGLERGDEITGFLYVGTPKATKPLVELPVGEFVSRWTG